MPKISIVTPFYNSELFIRNSIESVLRQTYSNWELILINDGSSDASKTIVEQYTDERIRCFSQANSGVVAARNFGLSVMEGDYFCFLDSDDVLTSNSLEKRMDEFRRDSHLFFVDGQVLVMDSELKEVKRKWKPEFHGNPLSDLVCLSGKSFFGATWMVKRIANKNYQMQPGLSHSEDLLFYLELSREGGIYGYINEVILIYRDSPGSAMKNLEGLENGYRRVYNTINQWRELDKNILEKYIKRSKRIMFRSYLRKGKVHKAVKVLTDWL